MAQSGGGSLGWSTLAVICCLSCCSLAGSSDLASDAGQGSSRKTRSVSDKLEALAAYLRPTTTAPPTTTAAPVTEANRPHWGGKSGGCGWKGGGGSGRGGYRSAVGGGGGRHWSGGGRGWGGGGGGRHRKSLRDASTQERRRRRAATSAAAAASSGLVDDTGYSVLATDASEGQGENKSNATARCFGRLGFYRGWGFGRRPSRLFGRRKRHSGAILATALTSSSAAAIAPSTDGASDSTVRKGLGGRTTQRLYGSSIPTYAVSSHGKNI